MRRHLFATVPNGPREQVMIRMTKALSAWGSPAFSEQLSGELERLPHAALPLQQGLAHSSQVSSEPFKVMLIDAQDETEAIVVKLGVFYSGITAGCSCADDPTAVEPQTEFCHLLLRIDKATGEASVSLLPD